MDFPMEAHPDCVRVVSVDPGTATLGVAVLDHNLVTRETTVMFGETNNAERATRHEHWKSEMRGGRDGRIKAHKEYLADLLSCVEPVVFAAESPFLRFGRVQAFEALVECFSMLRDVVWNYSPSVFVRRIDPITAKNYVGVSHIKTDKEDVQRAVVNLYKDHCGPGVDLSTFDEHTMDAIAVGHCLIQKYILNVELESTKKKKKRGRHGRRKKKGS